MDEVRVAIRAVAESLITHLKRTDETKYGPIAVKEFQFKQLVEEGQYEDVHIGDLPAGQYGVVKNIDGIDCLVFDTDNIPQEVLIENSELFLELHEQSNGFALDHRGGIAKTFKMDQEQMDAIFDRNENRVPRRLLPVLEEALILRFTEQRRNLSRGRVYDWRGEIASAHGKRGNDPQEAQHLISLCSTGYFDSGGFFDELYDDLVVNGIKTQEEFKEIVDVYIRKNPFAVFVRSSGMTAEDVCALATNKANKIGDYPGSPDFIDICGKGTGTHSVIDQSRDILEEDYNADVHPYRNQELEQYIIRVPIEFILE